MLGKELIQEISAAKVERGKLAFWWMGQSSYGIKLAGKILYMDLFLSSMQGRTVPPACNPEDITNADFFFGSHDHVDHIDRKVWPALAKASPKAKFVVPGMLIDKLAAELEIQRERFIGIDDGQTVEIDGLRITGVAAAHEFLDQDPATGRYPYMGYVVQGDGRTIYHSGDCVNYEGLTTKLRAFPQLDVMYLPINGRDAVRYAKHWIGNFTYQEALDLAGSLQPSLAVPSHYEMFEINACDPKLFSDYADVKYPDMKYWIGKHGTRVDV